MKENYGHFVVGLSFGCRFDSLLYYNYINDGYNCWYQYLWEFILCWVCTSNMCELKQIFMQISFIKLANLSYSNIAWKIFFNIFLFFVEQTFSKFLYLNKHLIRHCCLFFLFLINEFVYSKYFLYKY